VTIALTELPTEPLNPLNWREIRYPGSPSSLGMRSSLKIPIAFIAWASGPFGISRTAYLTVQWGMSGFWQTDARARHNPDGLTLKMNRPLQRR
jgi:hypothetical protein